MSMKALALYKKRLLKKINAIEVIEHREEEGRKLLERASRFSCVISAGIACTKFEKKIM